jgi:hypothetical protein
VCYAAKREAEGTKSGLLYEGVRNQENQERKGAVAGPSIDSIKQICSIRNMPHVIEKPNSGGRLGGIET